MRLAGKTALVSGAGRNNGKAIALRFAEEGADLLLVARELGEELGKLDIAINVVGLRPHRPFLEYSYEEWLLGFAVNTHTLFHLAQAVGPHMMERGTGSIVALGGMAASQPVPDSALVVSSKHALHGLVKSLARELGPHGVRVNLLNPGFIENVRKNPEWYSMTGGEPARAQDLEQTPLRRKGTNREVANAALFLASDESSYITGDRISCIGGRYMG